jgi:hypothetical protein
MCVLCPMRLLRPTTFVVGQSVTVAKRMMPGVNKEGGAARVTAITFENDKTTLYDVKYVVSTATEKRLPEALLSVPSAPSSFSTSSTLPSVEAELRRELEDTKRKYEEEVGNLAWQLREEKALVQRSRGRQKEALRQLATVSKEAERERVLRERDLKEVNDHILLLLEEAEEAAVASEDAVAKHERAKYSLERRRLQKEKRAAEEELERVRILCHVEQERVHSDVLGLLQERGSCGGESAG